MGDTIINLNGDYNSLNNAGGDINNNIVPSSRARIEAKLLIDVDKSLGECKLDHYHHFSAAFFLNDSILSVSDIFRKLEIFFSREGKRILSVLKHRENVTAKEILFKLPLKDCGAINHFSETAVLISKNCIQYEYAQYKSNADLNTNFITEGFPALLLLLFSMSLYSNEKVNIDTTIKISTSGTLNFIPNSNLISVYSNFISTYVLNPQIHEEELNINTLNKSIIIEWLQKMINGFVATSNTSNQMFLSVNQQEQSIALHHIGNHYIYLSAPWTI